MTNNASKLQKLVTTKVLENEPLAKYSTLKIGGAADLFLNITNIEDIAPAINFSRENNILLFVLGGGSNTLIGDKGFRGLVLKNSCTGIELLNKVNIEFNQTGEAKKEESHWMPGFLDLSGIDITPSSEGIRVKILSGTPLSYAITSCIEHDATGLEVFAGIPGTIGGAVWNNIHGAKWLIGQFLEEVEVLTMSGYRKVLKREELGLDYYDTVFHSSGDFILSATFVLFVGGKQKAREVANKWIAQKTLQPKNSIGSIFRNITEEQKASCSLDNLSTGYIIDKVLNLKGHRIGGVQICETHANLIITHPGATASDYASLIELVKETAKNKLGLDLIEEIVRVGEF